MKAHYQRLLNEGELIDFQWDRTNIKEIFLEILSLFNHQQEKIEIIDNSLSNYVNKNDYNLLK